MIISGTPKRECRKRKWIIDTTAVGRAARAAHASRMDSARHCNSDWFVITHPALYRRYQCALGDTVFSISNISVDAVVDRYVSSGISGAQRPESEVLRELTSIRDRVLCLPSVFFARVTLRHLSSMFVVRAEWSSIPESNKDWLQMCSNMIINFNYTIISD